jgi:hypothetical protein
MVFFMAVSMVLYSIERCLYDSVRDRWLQAVPMGSDSSSRVSGACRLPFEEGTSIVVPDIPGFYPLHHTDRYISDPNLSRPHLASPPSPIDDHQLVVLHNQPMVSPPAQVVVVQVEDHDECSFVLPYDQMINSPISIMEDEDESLDAYHSDESWRGSRN